MTSQSVAEIEAQIAELKARLEVQKREESTPGLSDLIALLQEHPNLSAVDFKFAHDQARSVPRRLSPSKGTKVPPKYRHPTDRSLTWTGRGSHPRWVSELLKKGRSLESLMIKRP